MWAHQAGEKAIKVLLTGHDIDPPKRHDLDRLVRPLPPNGVEHLVVLDRYLHPHLGDVRIASLDDVIRMKEAADRYKDHRRCPSFAGCEATPSRLSRSNSIRSTMSISKTTPIEPEPPRLPSDRSGEGGSLYERAGLRHPVGALHSWRREVTVRVHFPSEDARGVAVLSVADAAQALGVNPGRVRQLVAAGRLDAEKIGGRWLIPDSAVATRLADDRPVGRPLSPRAAWGLLEAAVGRSVPWLSPSEQRRARQRAQSWSLAHWASACERRAEQHALYAHRSVLGRLADDERVVRSGASARLVPVDLIAAGVVEGYVRSVSLDDIVGEYGLHRGAQVNVVLRVPPEDLFVFGDQREAAWPVVAVDLYDAGDDRSRRAGQALLDKYRA